METLIPILSAVFPTVEFDGLTIEEWSEIGAALLDAEPEIAALAGKLKPAVVKFLGKLKVNTAPAQEASAAVRDIPSEMAGVR
jgi:hypothetical protein